MAHIEPDAQALAQSKELGAYKRDLKIAAAGGVPLWPLTKRHVPQGYAYSQRFPASRVKPAQLRRMAIGWEKRGLPNIGASNPNLSTKQVVANYIASHGARSLAEAVARHRTHQIGLTSAEYSRARDLLGDDATELEVCKYARQVKTWHLRHEHGIEGADRVIARLTLVNASRKKASYRALSRPVRRVPRVRACRRSPRVARVASATSPPAPDGPPAPPQGSLSARAPRLSGGAL